LEALATSVQSAIRGDPEAALLWVSKSQRHLAGALAELGFAVGQKLVGRLLRRLGFSLQANSKTREGIAWCSHAAPVASSPMPGCATFSPNYLCARQMPTSRI
jgi:hypothetical protein